MEIDAVRKDRGGMNPDEWGKQIAGVSRAPLEKTERDDEGGEEWDITLATGIESAISEDLW